MTGMTGSMKRNAGAFCLSFLAVVSAIVLSACGGTTNGNESTPVAGSDSSSFSAASVSPASAGDALVFWHWWSDQQPVLAAMASDYAEQTGQVVLLEVASPIGSEYYNKLEAAAQGGTLPDIIGLAGGGERLARYINRDVILELTPELARDKWGDRFFPRGLTEMTFQEGNPWGVRPGSTWGVPLTVMDIQVVYNRDLFAAAGLDPDRPPATWDAWLEAGRKLRAIGVAPFGYGGGDKWMSEALLDVFAWSYLGASGIEATYRGTIPYTDPRWIAALDCFSKLRDARMFPDGMTVAPNKDAEVMFTQGEIGMAMNGSWSVNVFKTMNPHLSLGVFPFPAPPGATHPVYSRGGVGTAAAVTKSSRRAEAAVKFLRWLTEPAQAARLMREGQVLAAVRLPAGDTAAAVPGALGRFQAGFERVMPALPTEETRQVWDELASGVQSILIGRSTPQEVVHRVQAAKEAAVAAGAR